MPMYQCKRIAARHRWWLATMLLWVATYWSTTPLYSQTADGATTAISRLSADLMYLASDELAGRDVGSPGIAQAGEYIEGRFRQLGLVTELFDGRPYQEFTMPGPATLAAAEDNFLRLDNSSGESHLQLGVEFTPISLGSSGEFSGEIAFVGYGISAPDLNYDDYAELDVKGKVVIAIRKEPGQHDANSPFDGTKPSQHAYFSTKELNAAVHGAVALILVNDQVTATAAGTDQIPELTTAGDAISEDQIPTMFCQRAVIDRLLQDSLGKSLADLEDAIDRENAPHSHLLPGVRSSGKTSITQTQTSVRNVVGLLPGEGELADQYLVIGAHYDHSQEICVLTYCRKAGTQTEFALYEAYTDQASSQRPIKRQPTTWNGGRLWPPGWHMRRRGSATKV